MPELVLRFQNPVNILVFLVFLMFTIGWCGFALRNERRIPFIPVVCANVLLLVAWGMLAEVNHDDSAFLHFSWMISRGMEPFRDFWEHHSPLLSLLLSPLPARFPDPAAALDAVRVLSGALFLASAALGWRLARGIWGDRARIWVYLLLLTSMAVPGQYLILRPDLPMIFFLLAGLIASLDSSRRTVAAFCAGAAFGMAASFVPKQYFLFLVPVIVIVHDRQAYGWKLLAYFLGFGVGVMPLAVYLWSRGLTGGFLSWGCGFSSGLLLVTVYFPLILFSAAILGAAALARRFRESRCTSCLVGISAFCLSTLSSFTTSSESAGQYYLGFWFFVCAVTASGIDFPLLLERVRQPTARVLIAGVVLSYLLLPGFLGVWKYRQGDYARGKHIISELSRYAQGGSVLQILPYHALFAYDSTRLYSAWQFYYCQIYPRVREYVKEGGITERIIARRPEVITAVLGKRDFLLEMMQRKLISAREYSRLKAFLASEYVLTAIGEKSFYVRSDKSRAHNN